MSAGQVNIGPLHGSVPRGFHRTEERVGSNRVITFKPVKQNFTIYDRMAFPVYEFEAFPTIVYHPEGRRTQEAVLDKDGSLKKPQGGFIHFLVENQKELEEVLRQGWHLHPQQAAEAEAARLKEERAGQDYDAQARAAALESENSALRKMLLEQGATMQNMQKAMERLEALVTPQPKTEREPSKTAGPKAALA